MKRGIATVFKRMTKSLKMTVNLLTASSFFFWADTEVNYKISIQHTTLKPCYPPTKLHGVKKQQTAVRISKFVRLTLARTFLKKINKFPPKL
jgi:hypothetical protein